MGFCRRSTDSGAYTGSVYGSFYVTEGFHIDAVGSFGGIDYETTRSISYTLPGFETVNTQAVANPGGTQYSFSIGGGYDYSIGGLTLAPYTRTEYIGLDVDAYRERQGNGWGMGSTSSTCSRLFPRWGARCPMCSVCLGA